VKRVIFPVTNRVHYARQKLLLDELRKHFAVDVFQPRVATTGDLETYAILAAVEFKNHIANKDYDLALVRADRFELLLLAGICAYRGIPIAHIEGGADSGADVIDTRIRNAISQLADLHFVTDERARRAVSHITGSTNVYDVGSLDVSFAAKNIPTAKSKDDYILFLHHAIPGEDTETVYEAVTSMGYPIRGVKSNGDYKQSLMQEEYSPEEFISLMYHAKCFVGNSSALCKESSILGTPGVLVGSRQDGRVVGRNVLRVPHDQEEIKRAIDWQIKHGRYEPDNVYFKKDTEKTMVKIIKRHI
jgi:UDP-N-acetylglucosamine 2-epimerase